MMPASDVFTTYVLPAFIGFIGVVLYFVFARRKPDDVVIQMQRQLKVYTAEEVAQHNSRDDLWLVLKTDGVSKVYDVTSYVNEHPGGDAILTNAGADSTEAFTGPQHPPRVYDLIEDFCIGTIED
eukprot:TRINITY_DN93694_c0_g1_i1.p2 TRINITY_DN93694_c0_g1~~TRINITY_DN93694_c0_g1_i1.p2  ORF type:complete len:137 (-),score=17.76 TRINITY_DN93694_c0_g1_i1:269-643(-)